MKRWLCPTCNKGINAPSRMAADDVRRYCLGCSDKSGKLVQRICPALERERAAKKRRSDNKARAKRRADRVKRAAQRERDRERRHIMGYDVQALMKRWYKLKAWNRLQGKWRRMPDRLPTMVVRRGNKTHISAHAYQDSHRITMTVPAAWNEPTPDRVARLLMTIVHELAHLFAPPQSHHDEAYNKQLCRAVHAIWGSDVSNDIVSGPRGYALTHIFTKRLTEVLQIKEGNDD